jgi:hypothetical protein
MRADGVEIPILVTKSIQVKLMYLGIGVSLVGGE